MSSSAPVRLKHEVLIEPLVNQWYAWPLLISPHTLAMYIANSHLRIMQSFVAAPQVHADAVQDPVMRGGPFIQYGAGRVDEIRGLLRRTSHEQAHMVELAAAIQALRGLLAEEARGGSLEPLYGRVPEALRGVVELVYDLENRARIRFIEPLLYRSRYYDTTTQRVCLRPCAGDARAFALSTPVLEDPNDLHLCVPFASPALDELYRARHTPRPLGELLDLLGGGVDRAALARFVTPEPAPPRERYTGEGVRMRYFGHACVLLETRSVAVLFDPVVSHGQLGGIERFTMADLPDVIDYVVITHNHQDHCMLEPLLELRHRTRTVLVPRSAGGMLEDPSLRLILQQVGFRHVVALDELESIEIPGGSITGLPFLGEHADLDVRTKLGYAARLAGRTFLLLADSNNIEPRMYEHLASVIGRADVVLIGMECEGAPLSWLYGPLLAGRLPRQLDQSRRFDGSDCAKAIRLVDQFGPSHVYVYAMGQEPWLRHVMNLVYTDRSTPIVEARKLVEHCRSQGLAAELLFARKELLLSRG
jgi:L-ascorbate metabolism protein UlaG (beta-lactamase superfamily)